MSSFTPEQLKELQSMIADSLVSQRSSPDWARAVYAAAQQHRKRIAKLGR